MTQRRSASDRSDQGLSRSMPALRPYFISSSWASLKLGVCHGLTAPSASDFDGSGMTRPRSRPMTRPKPLQVSQAPSGELNENRLGVGA